ncbi:YppE family protein [Metabacillus arenae]|uniref:YppE family protein n=1 Tax=Metabacillus arenae TaxID=2771434 RepID=A0A926RY44_9BACI|nr:YppE family protein [Metabacillus arenae]MBD1381661.1 YppE family protein [Metabacillus arenae]
MKKRIILLTKAMLQLNNEAMDRHISIMEGQSAGYDFFEVVKPAVDEADRLTAEWKALVLKWIQLEKPKYIYPIQIETTIDHFEQLILQSYFPDLKKKRFKNMKESNEYIFNNILTEIEGD